MSISDRLEYIEKSLQRIEEGQEELHKKLFVDNNGKSLQSKVNSNSRCRKVVYYIGGVILTVVGFLLKDKL